MSEIGQELSQGAERVPHAPSQGRLKRTMLINIGNGKTIRADTVLAVESLSGNPAACVVVQAVGQSHRRLESSFPTAHVIAAVNAAIKEPVAELKPMLESDDDTVLEDASDG